jgi:cytochrome c oxidase subunit 3
MSDESHPDRTASPAAGTASSRPPSSGVDAGTFGMYLLLAALGMLFAASLVGYWVIRSQHQPWPPPGFPRLPGSLWISTLVILLASVTIQRAVSAARLGAVAMLRSQLLMTLLLGLVFIGLQTWAWFQVWQQLRAAATAAGPYQKLFYVLTGLHAVHVLGGLAPLAVTVRRAFAGAYVPSNHPGVRYCAMYWHFLDGVWCVLFAAVCLV